MKNRKNLNIDYAIKEFEEMERKKEQSGKSWEEFLLECVRQWSKQ
jgi:hypothetical protein